MTIIHPNAQNMFRCANLTPIFLTSPSSTNPSMATHVSWNGVFSYAMNKRLLEERRGRAYEGEPSHRPPTTQGDIDAPAQRMPERLENVPGRDRNSQDPKDRAASLQLVLPDDNAFNIATINQTGNDSHDVARGKCSRAEKLDQDQDQDLFIEKISSSPWT
jgi:hypothetical protein